MPILCEHHTRIENCKTCRTAKQKAIYSLYRMRGGDERNARSVARYEPVQFDDDDLSCFLRPQAM